jgi:hypothetical protein
MPRGVYGQECLLFERWGHLWAAYQPSVAGRLSS